MINIVSGRQFLLCSESFGIKGEMISFNEAMVDGQPDETIFSQDFVEERCKTHNVSVDDYIKTTTAPLETIKKHSSIRLYFGFDMFCQINMLALLAYFEQISFYPEIEVYICDEINLTVVDMLKISGTGYYSLYKQIVVEKKKITTGNAYLNKVIDYYFHYVRKDRSVIRGLLRDCSATDRHEQLRHLIAHDTQYGLGDTQWSRWLDVLQ